MPELPEVETIKIGFQKRIAGLKITKIQINSTKSFIGNPNSVEGQKVLKVWRRAKILGIDFDKTTLLFHLKMSGQLVWKGKSGKGKGERFIGGHPTPDMVAEMPNKHTRVIFYFSDGSHLYFNDQRKFGWVKVSEKLKVQSEKFFENLGPEPLEKTFTWEVLKQNLLKHKSTPVKVAIMDHTIVSGVGNIYANEACFDAKIDPRKKVGQLSDEEFESLHRGVINSLREGIKFGGATRAHFLDYAYVYGRNKHPCKKCKFEIKKIQLGGRGTYLCPKCQS